VAAGTVGVNRRGGSRPERGVDLEAFVAGVRDEVERRALPDQADAG
jgi:hypothetical protein